MSPSTIMQVRLLNNIAAPEGVILGYSYRGELLTGVTLSGPVAGTVNYAYDANYRITQDTVQGSVINYRYDVDDALIQAGELALTYDAASGLLNGTTLANVSDRHAYNEFGEPISYTASLTSSVLYGAIYHYDKLGRIISEIENISGATTSFGYRYDAAGRLDQVQQNGATIATYSYDANGNRTGGPGGVIGTYDAQDRLLTYGNVNYGYTANGELLTRTENGQTTTYDYDVMGNLMGVTLPDGTQITYLIDGQDRRIGKKVNGTLVQGFLYQDQLNPIAELDGSGNLVSRFIYGSRGHVPDYIIQGGNTYRIISDHLGSVRLVVNTQTGEIVQQMDYDAFGNVFLDTNPGLQPFGFAGGLYDNDTHLVRFGARDYDAEVGRWTTKDPIGFESGNTNLYTYVGNDPVNLIDPSGKIVPLLLGAWALIEIGLSIADAVSTAQTLADPCASFNEKALASGLFILGIFAPGGGYSTAARAPKLLNPPIKMTKKGLQHVLDRHTYSGISKYAKRSKFSPGENVEELIQSATQMPMTRQANGNYQRIVKANRTIGIDRTTGQPTDMYTVITDSNYNLVTAFPGVP
ncbi:MAG: RHS repeat-associated core domain-containing protein [Caldilineaceae bacterium]